MRTGTGAGGTDNGEAIHEEMSVPALCDPPDTVMTGPAGQVSDVADEAALVARATDEELTRARRWFTSFGSCSVTQVLDSLTATGLLEDAR